MNIKKNLVHLMLVFTAFTMHLNAQDGYTYTLIDNGSYNFTIAAVPNPSMNNFATSVQSYGFTIIVPDGVTASITSSLGNGAGATFFDGNNVGDSSIDGYLITETLGSPISLQPPSAGVPSNMVTIQIDGAPTSGVMYILENNSALATSVPPLKSFLSADMEDDGSAMYSNRINPNGSGTSGTSSFNFATLSVERNELNKINIYPNPVGEVLHISGNLNPVRKIEIYNSLGQIVLSENRNVNAIHVGNFQSGIYVVKISTESSTKSIKMLKS